MNFRVTLNTQEMRTLFRARYLEFLRAIGHNHISSSEIDDYMELNFNVMYAYWVDGTPLPSTCDKFARTFAVSLGIQPCKE